MKFRVKRVKEEEFIAGEDDRDLAKLAFNRANDKIDGKDNRLLMFTAFSMLAGIGFLLFPVAVLVVIFGRYSAMKIEYEKQLLELKVMTREQK